jgi:predicted metalloprotease with PDZ domain
MALRVTLEFEGGPQGKVNIELPSEWAGQQHLEKSIAELKVISSDTTIVETESLTKRELQFRPSSPVRLSYLLVKDWDGALNSGTRFRADLSPDYFHIIGLTSLIHPELGDLTTVDVHFDWQRLPLTWSLATSFGSNNRCLSFHGRWHDAINSLFVGGDYRIYNTVIADNALHFAIRGKWSFSDDEWVSQVRKIIEYERTFWHDHDFPYFLVTLTPLGQDRGSSGGTALTNVFMMHLSRLDSMTSTTLGTIAHETFHTWNPHKMGDRPGSDHSVSWFFEGFTVYYADLMLFRAGMMSFPDYVDAVNDKLRKYELNEGADVTLQDFKRRHAADYSVLNQLDYRRGAVLAMWLDATIRRESSNGRSLDNLMFDLVAQNATYQRRHKGQPIILNNQRILRAADSYIHPASRKKLRHYLEKGGSIRVPETALGPCVQSRVEPRRRFDLGFDIRSTRGNSIVMGVESGSEAYKTGLRDGQKLLGWSFDLGDTSREVRLRVESEHVDRVLKYYPQGPEVLVQQLSLDKGKYASRPGTCAAGW